MAGTSGGDVVVGEPLAGFRILLVDDEEGEREGLGEILRRQGHDVRVAPGGAEALDLLRGGPAEVLLTDYRMPAMNGLELIEQVRAEFPLTLAIVISAYGDIPLAVDAIRRGARDFLQKPVDVAELKGALARLREEISLRRSLGRLRQRVDSLEGFDDLVGQSDGMLAVYRDILVAARAPSAVLISGETGTGKELVCEAIHARSRRRDGALVKVNCAALQESLAESELFGHVRGAFTGAVSDQPGKFALADGGTLFLDEVEAIHPAVQAKLLRALQDGRYFPVGSNRERAVDVRIIAATNEDLDAAVGAGTFRTDLYYRLNVLRVCLPPLRERPEDVPLLVKAFLARHAPNRDIRSDALELLVFQSWPGNVRHLHNVLERALTLAVDGPIGREHLPGLTGDRPGAPRAGQPPTAGGLAALLEHVERAAIERALRETSGRIGDAAALLGIPIRSFSRKLHRYGLGRETGDV